MKHQHPELEEKIDYILTNHLPHIREKLARVEGALRWVFLPMAIAIVLALLKVK